MGVIWKFKSKWITPKVGRLAGFWFFFIQSFHVTLPTPIVLPFLWEGNSPEGETCSFFLILGYVSCLGEREIERGWLISPVCIPSLWSLLSWSVWFSSGQLIMPDRFIVGFSAQDLCKWTAIVFSFSSSTGGTILDFTPFFLYPWPMIPKVWAYALS